MKQLEWKFDANTQTYVAYSESHRYSTFGHWGTWILSVRVVPLYLISREIGRFTSLQDAKSQAEIFEKGGEW